MEYTVHPEQTFTLAVVEAISSQEGCSPLDLPPLSETIGTDELDRIFDPMDETGTGGHIDHVRFEYVGYTVTVYETGSIEVEPTIDQGVAER